MVSHGDSTVKWAKIWGSDNLVETSVDSQWVTWSNTKNRVKMNLTNYLALRYNFKIPSKVPSANERQGCIRKTTTYVTVTSIKSYVNYILRPLKRYYWLWKPSRLFRFFNYWNKKGKSNWLAIADFNKLQVRHILYRL